MFKYFKNILNNVFVNFTRRDLFYMKINIYRTGSTYYILDIILLYMFEIAFSLSYVHVQDVYYQGNWPLVITPSNNPGLRSIMSIGAV